MLAVAADAAAAVAAADVAAAAVVAAAAAVAAVARRLGGGGLLMEISEYQSNVTSAEQLILLKLCDDILVTGGVLAHGINWSMEVVSGVVRVDVGWWWWWCGCVGVWMLSVRGATTSSCQVCHEGGQRGKL